MNIKTQSCDICGIQRQPSNHWVKIFIVDGGLLILEWESVGPGRARTQPSVPDITSPDYSPEKANAHLCGHAHVGEWMSKEFFGKVKTD